MRPTSYWTVKNMDINFNIAIKYANLNNHLEWDRIYSFINFLREEKKYN